MATPYPPRKKTSPWLWVLVGVGAFVLIVSALLVAGGVFVYYLNPAHSDRRRALGEPD
jgi:hypothetical protein